MRTGLTKLRLPVIDMRTPRGNLEGASFGSYSTYRTGSGHYSGISLVDVEVKIKKTGAIDVEILTLAGVDSTDSGKFVQDFIRKKICSSPVFARPKGSLKPFFESGVATLVKPRWLLTQGS